MTPKAPRTSSSKTKTSTDKQSDFICAVSTATGRAALSVIRASGAGIFRQIPDIFRTRAGRGPADLEPRKAHYGFITSGTEVIDDVIFLRFEGKSSFSGEDSFEIHCHGNPLITRRIISLLYEHGLRAARPGEFTRRAYLNGKLDVDAAQAVAEIIEARSSEGLKAAQRLKSGLFRSGMLSLRSSLMNLLADLNAELDFIDEDISFATLDTKLRILAEAIGVVEKLRSEALRFNAFKDGVNIAIVGKPNAGKSSLMNRLLGEDRSIVSDIAGTTRDYIEGELSIAGYNVRLFDTAGLNDKSDDPIEKLGIERTRELIGRAHICLQLIDGSAPVAEPEKFKAGAGTDFMAVVNKSDQLHSGYRGAKDRSFLYISAKTGDGIAELLAKMEGLISHRAPSEALPLNAWQLQMLAEIGVNLASAATALKAQELPEVISHTVGLAVEKIAELTGEISSEDILGRIFSRFCIGK